MIVSGPKAGGRRTSRNHAGNGFGRFRTNAWGRCPAQVAGTPCSVTFGGQTLRPTPVRMALAVDGRPAPETSEPRAAARYNAAMPAGPHHRILPNRPGVAASLLLVPVLLLAVIAAGTGCPSGDRTGVPASPAAGPAGRVILFGIDGADWQIIDPLMA